MTERTAARVAWTIGGIALGATVAATVLHALTPNDQVPALARSDSVDLVYSLVEAAGIPIGVLIASRQPTNPLGWLFLTVSLVLGLSELGTIYAAIGLVAEPGSLPAPRVAGWLGNWVWTLGVGSLPFLTLLFPTGRPHSRRWRPVVWAAAAVLLILVGTSMLIASGIWRRPLLPEARWPEAVGGLLPVLMVALPLVLAIALVGAASMIFRYRAAETEERQQIKWVIVGATFLVLTLAFDSFAEGPLAPLATTLGTLALYASLGIAILKYRLYDIDLVINRTLVYGALAAFITAVYVGVVVGIGRLVGAGNEGNLGLQIGATALVAVLFQPVRTRVQHLANRLVYGTRSTPYEVMAEFGERMAGSLRVEEVLPQIAEAAVRGVAASAARVRIDLTDGSVRAARWPSESGQKGTERVLPVTHRGERVGEIAVVKAPGDPVRAQDEAVLRDLASQAGLALHNVRLAEELRARVEQIGHQAEELRASQQRIVSAGDDERRLLERTIEARIERRIEELADRLRTATGLLEEDPDRCAALLEEAGAETQATLEELREIARGIYPPLLADKGLAAALDAQAARAAGTVRIHADGVARYGPEVEAGVYFCCLEAIQHATEELTIEVADEGNVLRLTIEAPGGADAETLVRIADRVDALGGELLAEGDGGATLSATIPVRAAEPAA